MIQEGDKVYCKNFDEYGLEDRPYTVIGVLDNIVWVSGVGFDVDFPACIFIKVNPFTISYMRYKNAVKNMYNLHISEINARHVNNSGLVVTYYTVTIKSADADIILKYSAIDFPNLSELAKDIKAVVGC